MFMSGIEANVKGHVKRVNRKTVRASNRCKAMGSEALSPIEINPIIESAAAIRLGCRKLECQFYRAECIQSDEITYIHCQAALVDRRIRHQDKNSVEGSTEET